MGYLWLGLSGFVHIHAIFVIITVLPLPTSNQWNWILDNCVVNFFTRLIGINIMTLYLAMACPCFVMHLDAIREYMKYSSVDYELLGDYAKKSARIRLLYSQRNYYISGAAMILCLLVPRIISIRLENARKIQDTENILKTIVKEVLHEMRQANAQNENRDNNDRRTTIRDSLEEHTHVLLLESIRMELERINRERENVGDMDRMANAPDLNHLRIIYEEIRNQGRVGGNNNHQYQIRQRLARSRFSSAMPNRQPRPNYRFMMDE